MSFGDRHPNDSTVHAEHVLLGDVSPASSILAFPAEDATSEKLGPSSSKDLAAFPSESHKGHRIVLAVAGGLAALVGAVIVVTAVAGVIRSSTPPRVTVPLVDQEAESTATTTKASPLVETSAPQPPGIPSYDAEAGDPRFGRPPGLLEIASDPPGARVSINGLSRGVTPLVLDELPSGSHTVSISLHGAAVQRAVNLAPGRTATIIAAFAPNGPVEGWLSVEAPFDMQVREYGALVGTTSAGRLAMPEGRHELDLVSEAYGFRTRAEVRISSGKVATVTVKVPSGLLSVTALPWAEVWIDGKPAGATPLTDVPVPIGPHEVLFWHPEFGERRLSVAVTAATPAQVGVDFTR